MYYRKLLASPRGLEEVGKIKGLSWLTLSKRSTDVPGEFLSLANRTRLRKCQPITSELAAARPVIRPNVLRALHRRHALT
jgi:hypothetical protein